MARITVVNDYPEFLAVMQELVDRAGDHDFRGFDGAASTYEEIAATAPDVLIIDLRLVRQRAADFERIGNIHIRLEPFDTAEMIDLIKELASQRPSAAD